MDYEGIVKDCVKYCILKRKTGNVADALKHVSKALVQCDGSETSIKECILLLKVLSDEE